MRSIMLIICFIGGSLLSADAQLPVSHAFAFTMKQVTDSIYLFKEPRFLSGFNVKGYNNQPFFVDDTHYFLTLSLPGGMPDIYRFDLESDQVLQVTATAKEGEYSAIKIPGTDSVAAIHVDSSQEIQQLVQFPLDQSDPGRVLFPEIENAGYHVWLNDTLCALFLVGEPHELHMGYKKSGATNRIARSIGRCLKTSPEGELYYVQSLRDGKKYIYRYDPWLEENEFVIACLEGSEDFEVLPDGRLLMARGPTLYVYHSLLFDDWIKIADFSEQGLTNITRLGHNGTDQLILINLVSTP